MRAIRVSVALLALVTSSACGYSASATERAIARPLDGAGKQAVLLSVSPWKTAKERLIFKNDLNAGLTRRVMTTDVIDLRPIKHPTLHIRFKGSDAAQFRVVWAVDGGDYVEERVIAAPFRTGPGGSDRAFDLSQLKDTPGQLVIVGKVMDPRSQLQGPLLDSVALIDEAP